MEILNFDNFERPPVSLQKHYDGQSGNKEHILINGEDYFLKYPKRIISERNKFKNVELSYSNSPLSEFIGSHFYEILGFNVHKTVLGYSQIRGYALTACKDFLSKGDSLDEFKKIKVSYAPIQSENESNSSGEGCNLDEIISVIKTNPFLNSIGGIEEHFWDMFVVDAFIGNMDRNNGNWGIIRHIDGQNEISPIYDNGNSFNNKWDEQKIVRVICDNEMMKSQAYKGRTCIFTKTDKNGDESFLNPYKVIASMQYKGLNEAVERLVPKLYEKKKEFIDFIESIPNEVNGITIISETQKLFFKRLIKIRYNEILNPTFYNIKNPDCNREINFKTTKLDSDKTLDNEWLSKS